MSGIESRRRQPPAIAVVLFLPLLAGCLANDRGEAAFTAPVLRVGDTWNVRADDRVANFIVQPIRTLHMPQALVRVVPLTAQLGTGDNLTIFLDALSGLPIGRQFVGEGQSQQDVWSGATGTFLGTPTGHADDLDWSIFALGGPAARHGLTIGQFDYTMRRTLGYITLESTGAYLVDGKKIKAEAPNVLHRAFQQESAALWRVGTLTGSSFVQTASFERVATGRDAEILFSAGPSVGHLFHGRVTESQQRMSWLGLGDWKARFDPQDALDALAAGEDWPATAGLDAWWILEAAYANSTPRLDPTRVPPAVAERREEWFFRLCNPDSGDTRAGKAVLARGLLATSLTTETVPTQDADCTQMDVARPIVILAETVNRFDTLGFPPTRIEAELVPYDLILAPGLSSNAITQVRQAFDDGVRPPAHRWVLSLNATRTEDENSLDPTVSTIKVRASTNSWETKAVLGESQGPMMPRRPSGRLPSLLGMS